MKDGTEIPVAELCAHTAWLRALARRLVRDEALADDLVQESLLRAVESPPRWPGALRSWLRTVLERLAINERQKGRGRERHELAAARPERSDSTPAAMLEGVELQGELVQLVLALEEPYRSAVVLRYFQEWSTTEIARRQGVDTTTVRWRLRRALELLRARLDRSHGSRAAWCAAFAATLWCGRGAKAGIVASNLMAVRSLVSGVAIMKLKTFVIAAVLSLLLLLGLLVPDLRERPAKPDAVPAPVPATVALREASPPLPVAPVEPRPPVVAETLPVVTPPVSSGPVITGQVIDGESGEPIPRAMVRARGSVARSQAGDDGAYRLEGLPDGEHYLVAAAPGHAEEHARVALDAPGEFVQDFFLERAVELLVRVTDREGKPLEAVQVTASQPNGSYIRDEEYTRVTDAEGKATLTGIGRERKQQVNARKQGYREVWTRDYVIADDDERAELSIAMEKRLEGDAVVAGRVTDAAGAPLRGVNVQWIHGHGEHKGRVVVETARDGAYRLEFPREGDWCAISAFGDGFSPAIREGVRAGNAAAPATVDFTLTPGHRLEGNVVDEEDHPVAGVRILALPTIYHLRNTSLEPGNGSEARTDERGRFALGNLAAPTTALRLEGPAGEEWANNFYPQVKVDARAQLRLLRWGAIRGRVIDRETGEPVKVFSIKLKAGTGYYDYARTSPGEFFNSPEGLFVLKKLDQGPIELLVESDGYISKWVRDAPAEREERAPVHDVRITKGRTLEGIVLDAASETPLQGARVVFGAWDGGDLAWDEGAFKKMVDRQEAITSDDGTFRVTEGEPGTLFVRRAGYARAAFSPAEWKQLLDAAGRLRVPLGAGTALRGTLFEDGKPSRNGFLVLYSTGLAGGEERREWIGNLDRDSAGRFRAEDLTPRDYILEHWRETPGKRTAGLSIQKRIRLEAAKETTVDFGADLGSLAFLGRLLTREGKAHDRTRLTLRPDFEWAYAELTATVDAQHDGRFHFVGLVPGRYLVEVASGAGGKATLAPVEIEADLERDLVTPLGE